MSTLNNFFIQKEVISLVFAHKRSFKNIVVKLLLYQYHNHANMTSVNYI